MPIRSLPEEWLWCEAWCGNASLVNAKTIDLCNNPLTKEPKLEQARRIGGERWLALDSQMEVIMAKAAEEASAGLTAAKDEL